MVATFERKRDAAFKLLATLGFEWDGKEWVPRLENTSGWLSPHEHQSMLVVGDAMCDYVVACIGEQSKPGTVAAHRARLKQAAEKAMATDPVLVAALADPKLHALNADCARPIHASADDQDYMPDDVAATELWLVEAWGMTTNGYERHQT